MPLAVVTEEFYHVALEEGEPRRADGVLYGIAQVVGAEAVAANLRGEDFTERRLAVCHVALWGDVEDAVVHEPGVALSVVKWVAVGSLDGAVGGQSEVQEARLGYVAPSLVAQQGVEAHAFVVVGRCDQTAAMWVCPVHGCYNLFLRRLYASRYEANYAHFQ